MNMNKRMGKIGSAVAGLSGLCFAVCMLLQFDFGSYLVCMFLAIGYLMMVAGFYAECGQDRRALGILSVTFAGIYATLILLVYFTQTTTVRLDSLNETALQILDYKKFGLFFNLDLLGYGMMALSTFLIGLTICAVKKRDQWLKILLMVHGIFFVSCFSMPMLGIFSAEANGADWMGILALEMWCVYFLPTTILSYLHFNDKG